MISFRMKEILAQKKLDTYENTYPHSTYISPVKFPEQMNIVGSEVNLSVRDDYEVSYNEIRSIPSSGRPEDDHPYVPITGGADEHESPYYFEEYPAIVLRCDATEPYVFIAVTIDYEFVLIGNSKFIDDIISGEIVLEQPMQYHNMIGAHCYDRYNYIDEPEMQGRIIRVDARNRSDGVVAERVGEDEIRYVLFSECEAVLPDELPEHYDDTYKNPTGTTLERIKEIRQDIIENNNL